MKILMTSILNMNKDMNGVTVSAKELRKSLEKYNNQVGLVTPYTYPADSLLFKALRVNALIYHKYKISMLILSTLFLKALIIFAQVRKLKKEYDIFHAHDLFAAFGTLLAIGKNASVILHVHFPQQPWDEFAEAGYVKRNDFSYSILRFFSIRLLQSKRVQLLHVSQHNSYLTQTYKRETNPAVLYPGLELETRPEMLENKANYLINVGTMNNRKNQIFLIDILAELEKLGISIPLVLVGPEDEYIKHQIVKRMNELQVKSKVYFFGQQTEEKTRQLIANAKLYVHTSLRESFGRTLIEAVNLHTPVLARRFGAINEILDDEAVIESGWDAAQTARHLYKFLKNKTKRKRLQQKQYKNFLNKFTEEKMIETYINYVHKSRRLICA